MLIGSAIAPESPWSEKECPGASAVEITRIDPVNDSRWDEWVQSHEEATFFHSSAWARVLVRTYGHTPYYLQFARRGKLLALVPLMEVRSPLTGRRGVCVPFSDFCAPLVFDADFAPAVLNGITEIASERRWRHLELRGPLGSLTGGEDAADWPVDYLGHVLTVGDDPAALFSKFSSATRGAIRKAQKCNITAEISTSREAILEFYRLHQLTRKRHGVPPQPLAFFLNIYEEIIERGMGFVVRAPAGSVALASAVYFKLGTHAIYKFGASQEEQREVRGNNLVMWEAIQFLARSGTQTLDFGRTSLNNPGLRRFKRSWGTVEKELRYFKFHLKTRTWVTSRDKASGLHSTLFSQLPKAVNRLAGELIYPHLD